MFKINMIPENEQRHRTWEEICTDFPGVSIAIKDPDSTCTSDTGGTVVAYSINGVLNSESDLYIFAIRNGYLFSDTILERSALTLQ